MNATLRVALLLTLTAGAARASDVQLIKTATYGNSIQVAVPTLSALALAMLVMLLAVLAVRRV